MLGMHSTRYENFKQHWRLSFPTADKKTYSCTLRQKELFLFVFPDEGPDFTYLFSNCQQMLKNNFLSNEYVLKTQLLRYCVTAQGLVLVEKVFYISCIFLILVSILFTYLKKSYVKTTWKREDNKSGHLITCQYLYFCPLTLSIPI